MKRFRVAELPQDRALVMALVSGPAEAARAVADGADLLECDGELEFPELADELDTDELEVVTIPDGDVDETLAAASIAAWSGVRVLRTPDVRQTRKVVEMVASIAGTRPPARAVRALA